MASWSPGISLTSLTRRSREFKPVNHLYRIYNALLWSMVRVVLSFLFFCKNFNMRAEPTTQRQHSSCICIDARVDAVKHNVCTCNYAKSMLSWVFCMCSPMLNNSLLLRCTYLIGVHLFTTCIAPVMGKEEAAKHVR